MKPETTTTFINPFSVGIDLESGEMANAVSGEPMVRNLEFEYPGFPNNFES